MELSDELTNVSKGRVSLAEALKELELSKQAMAKAEHIQSLLDRNHNEMSSLRNTIAQLISLPYFNARIEDLSASLEKSIRLRFDEFSSTYFAQLSSKVSQDSLETHLQKKVPWTAFNAVSQQLGSLQTRLDKHIFSEYEGFKTKIKLELASKANENKGLDLNNEDFTQLKTRLMTVEQKIEEMFMEEDAMQDDDDYDSQEEMDNIIEDIDIVAKREDTNEGDREDNQSTTPELETTSFVKSEVSLNSDVVNEISEVALVESEKKIEPRLEVEKPVSRQSRARGSSIGGESRAMQRRGSKESSVAASRILAGGAGMKQLNRKIITIQKDIENNRTDIEENKKYFGKVEADIESAQQYTESVENKVKDMQKTIDVMEASFIRALRRNGIEKKNEAKQVVVAGVPRKDLDAIDKKIEDKFRRILVLESDFEKIQVEAGQIKKFYKEKINEIIVTLKNFDEFRQKAMQDIEKLSQAIARNFEKCKAGEVGFSEKFFELKEPMTDLISDQQRENQILNEDLKRHQELFRALVEELSVNKYNHRSNSEQPEIVEQANKIATNYLRKKRPNCTTPDMSLKNQFYKTNFIQKTPGVKTNTNWLGTLPDGKAVSLPRVAAKEKIQAWKSTL